MKLKTTFREALCLAQLHAMERDASVLLYGLDVGDHKDTFGSTKGLKQKFGENRVIATRCRRMHCVAWASVRRLRA
jgi:pyruvate/2-oxoglutarate/acetoin dehydrogenase E1 component